MLEQLADHDDELLEQLLMDQSPSREKVLQDLARETGENLGVSVLFGSRQQLMGRSPPAQGASPRSAGAASDRQPARGRPTPSLYAFKVIHGSIGRLALSRVLGGRIAEGSDLKTEDGEHARVGSLFKVQGEKTQKVSEAPRRRRGRGRQGRRGQSRRMAGVGKLPPPVEVDYPARNCAIAIEPADRKDDVKLSGALHRLTEEDSALLVEHDDANHEIRLRGVNDEHLNAVVGRLKRRYGVEVKSHPPTVGYRESIRKPVTQQGRHKKQSGGHGQFGDVIIEVKPLGRGEGFQFEEKIHGGSIPKQWIPAVEEGVREAMHKGPLGFQVVDLLGDADRRQLSQRRQFGARVPPRRTDRDARSARRRPAALARADAQDHASSARPARPAGSPRRSPAGAVRCSAWRRATAGPAGTGSRR